MNLEDLIEIYVQSEKKVLYGTLLANFIPGHSLFEIEEAVSALIDRNKIEMFHERQMKWIRLGMAS